MRVLITNPPTTSGIGYIREDRCEQKRGMWTTTWPPLTLAMCGAVCEEAGWEVRIHDCDLEGVDREGFTRLLRSFQPELILLNCTTPTLPSDLAAAKLVKELLPRTKLAACGVHVTALGPETLADAPDVDFCLRGEPEETLVDIGKAIEAGAKDFTTIAGMACRAPGGEIVRTEERVAIRNLDQMPFPAWHLIDLDNYRLPLYGRRFLLVYGSRGCPHSCSYCTAPTFYGHKLRLRTPQRIVEEMLYCKERFGVEDFLFWSESFTLAKKHVQGICEELIAKDANVRWASNSRVDDAKPELLALMRRAGCWMISLGIESASQETLDHVVKRAGADMAKTAVTNAKAAGLQVAGHFILGLPGETRERMRQTIDLAKALPLDYAQFYCAVPFPGAPLYQEALDSGLITSTDWSRYEQDQSVMDLGNGVGPADIMALRTQAMREFYLRPRMIWKMAGRLKNPTHAFRLAKGVALHLLTHKNGAASGSRAGAASRSPAPEAQPV